MVRPVMKYCKVWLIRPPFEPTIFFLGFGFISGLCELSAINVTPNLCIAQHLALKGIQNNILV